MFRTLPAVLIVGAAIAQLPSVLCAQDALSESELRRHLAQRWNVLTNQIVTAEIEFTKGAIVVSPPTISLQELNALIEKYDLANHPENREAFTQDVLQGTPPLGNPWIDRKLYVKGRSLRDEGFFSIVSTPDHLVYHDSSNNHITVFAAGRSQLSFHSLNDFLQLPMDAETVVNTWPVELDSKTGGILLHPPPYDSGDLTGCYDLVDFSTGLPIRWTTVVDGRVLSDSQCHSVVELPGGISFPMLTYKAMFRGGKLNRLEVFHVQSIRVNEDLADSIFHMPAKAGASVFDDRFDDQRGTVLKNDVPDVVAFFDGGGIGQPTLAPPPEPATLSLEKILLFINGMLLVLGGVVLWRRSNTSHSHDSRL